MSNIINSWSLINFVAGRKLKLAHLENKQTKEPFAALAVCSQDDSVVCFVGFSKNLGELTAQQIVREKDNLNVVQCTTEEGKEVYRLCKAGEGSWEEFSL